MKSALKQDESSPLSEQSEQREAGISNTNLKRRILKEPPPIIQWIGVIFTIAGSSGATIHGILVFLSENIKFPILINSILTNTILIYFVVYILLIINSKKVRCLLYNVLLVVESMLKPDVKNRRIQELEEKIDVLKNAIEARIPAQAGHYWVYKREFDKFKTELSISECELNVCLVDKGDDKPHLQFEWKLRVINTSEMPIPKAKFIYSGDKNENSYPKVTVDTRKVNVEMSQDKNIIGDYRRLNILFDSPLDHNRTADIVIRYTLSEYKFNPKFDFIWIVPDALGFADMSQFHIRFFADGKIITRNTQGVLRSYKLSGECDIEGDEPIAFEDFEDNKGGFQCTRRNNLHSHGYLLILINDPEQLPDYLLNIPMKRD